MVNYKVHLVAKCPVETHSPDITVSSVVSFSYTAVDIKDNYNFAIILGNHIIVDYHGTDRPPHHHVTQACH